MSDEGVWGEIGRFDDEYKPDPGMRPNLKTLADGDYDFDILEADVGTTSQQHLPIFKLWLRASGGACVEHAYMLDSVEAVNRLGFDLAALGFAEFKQGSTVPFSRALKAAVPKLVGVRFRARKATEVGRDPQKPFHKLYIAGRVGPGSAAPPAAAKPAPPAAPAKTRSPVNIGAGTIDEAPF